MNEPTALQVLIGKSGATPCSYSGRAMYGAECLAATLDEGVTAFEFFADLLEQARRDRATIIERLDTITAALRSARVDHMGKGLVVYFPGFEHSK